MTLEATVAKLTAPANPTEVPIFDFSRVDWSVLLVNWALAGLIALIGWWLAKWVSRALYRAMIRTGAEPTLAGFLRNMAYAVVLVVSFITALQKIGVSTTSLLAVLGAAGLAVGLAMKDSLSNIASGVMLIVLRPFRDGDSVQAAGLEGVIEEVRIFQTRMRTADNRLIVLPNSMITTAPIINFTAKPQRRIDIVVGVSYEDDPQRAREILMSIATGNPLVLKMPEPVVQVSRLGEGSVELTLMAWSKTKDFGDARSQMLEAVRSEILGNGLSLPSAQRDVHVYHHNQNSSPTAELPDKSLIGASGQNPTPPAA